MSVTKISKIKVLVADSILPPLRLPTSLGTTEGCPIQTGQIHRNLIPRLACYTIRNKTLKLHVVLVEVKRADYEVID